MSHTPSPDSSDPRGPESGGAVARPAWVARSLGIVCALGLTATAFLLFIASYDFYRLVNRPLAVAMLALMAALFAVGGCSVVALFATTDSVARMSTRTRAALVAAIPLALLSSRLSC